MIRKISAEETYPVRQQVLRPGRPAREVFFEGDLEPDTFHLGYFDAGKILGVATYVSRKNNFFEAAVQYQLRGMAVLPNHRGKNIGEELLLKGEKLLKSKDPEILLWFNAREVAIGFYKKYGYQAIGNPFMIPNVCMHIVMHKKL
ncbi:Acetyltransferase (GNAT) domain-containing protein [Salinimicrobium sediminis]|uniref:Acetyltransferase (GNAT) domain-containing protein n=1 Tax=Salinimicrobium sediminis TaxID=1343891 RepID=A0A285X1T3_9FLAO|nr:GNAT family N-acetyltransferase [Salinimicrobium sediminis]SOC78684.1 Acetyltransferase (GNAT) domain-containing protein [Salinimicrobium sediminis]